MATTQSIGDGRELDEMRERARRASLRAAESLERSARMHERTAEVHEKSSDFAGIDPRHLEAGFYQRKAVQHREAARRRAMAETLRTRAETE